MPVNEEIAGGQWAALFIFSLTFANERQLHRRGSPDILRLEFSECP